MGPTIRRAMTPARIAEGMVATTRARTTEWFIRQVVYSASRLTDYFVVSCAARLLPLVLAVPVRLHN